MTAAGARRRPGGPRGGRRGLGQRARVLVLAAAVLSAGHHLDHVVRGNHVGWPLTDEVTAFTGSLVVYPLIAAGLWLDRTGRAGPGWWLVLSGTGVVFLAAMHLGPTALEPPGDIVGPYENPLLGGAAFAWLLALLGLLAALAVHEARLLARARSSREEREGP